MRIEVTNECNLNCTYCHAIPNSRKGTITLELVEQAINKNVFHPEMGQITISGGEPFLYPELTFNIAKLLQRHAFTDIKIQTNGTLITDNAFIKFKEIKNLSLKFSLDSHLEHIHNNFRQKFYHTISSIKTAVNLGYKVFVTHVITSSNYSLIPQFIDFCKILGIRGIQFRKELGGHTGLTEEMVSKAIGLIDGSYTTGIKISKKSCINEISNGCLGRSCLMTNGDILPCGNIKVPIGNIKNISAYKELIYHPLVVKMKEAKECSAVAWTEGRL